MTCKIQITSISYIYSLLTQAEQRGTSKTIYKMQNIKCGILESHSNAEGNYCL